MKYLGYIPLIAAFIIGYCSLHPALVIACALASTLIFMSARRAQVRHEHYTGDRNMVIDGAYLATIQGLIMFATYLFGWLMVRQMDNILAWLHLA